jgi:hypothetical protein
VKHRYQHFRLCTDAKGTVGAMFRSPCVSRGRQPSNGSDRVSNTPGRRCNLVVIAGIAPSLIASAAISAGGLVETRYPYGSTPGAGKRRTHRTHRADLRRARLSPDVPALTPPRRGRERETVRSRPAFPSPDADSGGRSAFLTRIGADTRSPRRGPPRYPMMEANSAMRRNTAPRAWAK